MFTLLYSEAALLCIGVCIQHMLQWPKAAVFAWLHTLVSDFGVICHSEGCTGLLCAKLQMVTVCIG